MSDIDYFIDELAKHAQSIHWYNKQPWYKKIFIIELKAKCRMKEGFNCACKDKKHRE